MSELIGVFPIQFVIKTKIKQAQQFRMCAFFFNLALFWFIYMFFSHGVFVLGMRNQVNKITKHWILVVIINLQLATTFANRNKSIIPSLLGNKQTITTEKKNLLIKIAPNVLRNEIMLKQHFQNANKPERHEKKNCTQKAKNKQVIEIQDFFMWFVR